MQRREAVLLFREITECIPDPSLFQCVFLRYRGKATGSSDESFELQIQVVLDKSSLNRVENIVKKRRLVLEEKQGVLLIYSPEKSLIEILA